MATTGARTAMVAVAVATLTTSGLTKASADEIPLLLHLTDDAHRKTRDRDDRTTGNGLEAERLAAGLFGQIGVRGVCTDGCATGAAADGTGHVRSTDKGITTMISRASELSATFRRLKRTIDDSDGLVYIQPGKCGPGLKACLLMSVTLAGPYRLLRINVSSSQEGPELMGRLGHELQHAVEALSERGVTSGALLYAFFERLSGMAEARPGGLAFETTAALHAGDRVQDEVEASLRAHAQTRQRK
jgi:hypothetical protein